MSGPGAAISGAKSLWHELSSDDASDFAASLSYRFFLALFPFFIFVTALGGLVAQIGGFDNPATRLVDRFGDALPSDARSVVETQLTGVLGDQRPGLLSVGLLGTIWAASGGVGALMKATNRMYDVEETRPFWKRTVIALGLTLLGGLFFIGAFVLAVAGRAIAREVVDALALGGYVQAGIAAAGYLAALVLLLVSMAFLYWATPNATLPFRWVSPGAVLFAFGWLIATVLFGLYVSNFGSYNATYGALGGVVILLIWFYLTAYILLAGAELNAMLAQRQAPEEATVPAPDPGRWEGESIERADSPDEAARSASGQRTGPAAGGPSRGTPRAGERAPEASGALGRAGAAWGLAGLAVTAVALVRAARLRGEQRTPSAQ
ncbi:MAG: YihY/virulence factor BrkB family protein [Dehalococcoidia bacterium]